MEKLDLKRTLEHLYAPSEQKVELVEVPAFNFVMLDGRLDVGEAPASSPAFHQHIEAMYGASYTLKFASKLRKDNPIDYTVMALEGLWWTDSGSFQIPMQEPWNYTLMILQPEHITREMFLEAVEKLKAKKDNSGVSELRFEGFTEGPSIQIMHIGPYADEPRSIEKLHTFARENGYHLHGQHHEIYLGDPRRAKPEKLKTILRQSVRGK